MTINYGQLNKKLTQINKEVKQIFKSDKNFVKSENFGDFIHIEFLDINKEIDHKEIHQYLNERLLEIGINIKSENLGICFPDGDCLSIQPLDENGRPI